MVRDLLADCLSSRFDSEVKAIDHDRYKLEVGEWLMPLDIILLDLRLPEMIAVEIARSVRDRSDGSAKVILLVPDECECLIECIAAGADGVILERSSVDELHSAIERVSNGEKFCSPEVVALMFEHIRHVSGGNSAYRSTMPIQSRLTIREQQVLRLLDERKSNKEIAAELRVSLFTVKNHVHNILDKLDVENRMEAVDLARANPQLID
ncbi:response regulator transcription factor [Roseiconus lacunae]|uniref:Response regulator transcription factor n=1 Tax=Roseiconus lacunae TaxID=2605694 RepID=A0ABT7PPA8_9BACT|nr:response regulator transcription factor [Roseiconus lacunae]MDM4018343.1 response regulator transcription factor [Roseiconus lacunae]